MKFENAVIIFQQIHFGKYIAPHWVQIVFIFLMINLLLKTENSGIKPMKYKLTLSYVKMALTHNRSLHMVREKPA